MRVLLALLAATLMAGWADGRTYRIRGREVPEEELRSQYEGIRTAYIRYGNEVLPAGLAGAFSVSFKVERVVEPKVVVGSAVGPVAVAAKPDSASGLGARTGKEFTIAETDGDILGDISKGGKFAVRLEKAATDMPLSGVWPMMLVDSQTYLDRVKQGRIKARDLGRLRVLYDVTIDFDTFVGLLQRGQVFPGMEGEK